MVAKTYSIKPVIMARALAEMSVLAILSALPMILFFCGQFMKMHIILRAGLCLLVPFALLGLWGFAQIAFKVTIDEIGLSTRSIFKRSSVAWAEIQALKQTNRLGLREFSVIHKNGSLSFPSLLSNAGELVESIRQKLPDRGRSTTGDAQTYRVAPIMQIIEFAKLIFQFAFAGIFFWFYDSLKHGSKASSEDTGFVLALAILILVAVLWKTFQSLRMPHEVKIDKNEITLRGLFATTKLTASSVKKLSQTSLVYPEGMALRTDQGTFIIGNHIDCFDELAEELQSRATINMLNSPETTDSSKSTENTGSAKSTEPNDSANTAKKKKDSKPNKKSQTNQTPKTSGSAGGSPASADLDSGQES